MKSIRFIYVLSLGFTLSLSVYSNDNYLQPKDSLMQVISSLKGEEKLNTYEALLSTYDNVEITDQTIKEYLQFSDAASVEAQKQGNMKESGRFMINTVVFLTRNKRWKELDECKSNYLNFTHRHELWSYYYGIQSLYIENYYLKVGQTDRAINEAKALYEKAKTDNNAEGKMVAQLSIASALKSQRRNAEAEISFENGLNSYTEEIIKTSYLNGWWAYCSLLIDMQKWEKAIDKISQLDKLNQQFLKQINRPYPFFEAVILRLYAHAYCGIERLTDAEVCLNKADSLSRDLIGLTNSQSIRAEIANKRGQYDLALEHIAQAHKLRESKNDYIDVMLLKFEATVWSAIEKAENTLLFSEKAFELADSLSYKEFNQQLDELRTQYEVDKYIAEKGRIRNYLYLSIAICLILLAALVIWIYYNRQITRKNKALAKQIKELQTQYDKNESELLRKSILESESIDDNFCPQKRKDMLCIAIRDIMLKEKVYRNSALTRDRLIELLGTNKELFIDAFQFCFEMSFPEYINFLRLRDALTLLEKSDLTVEEVSEKVGFGTVRTFQRQFQNKYNMSPKDYRKVVVT